MFEQVVDHLRDRQECSHGGALTMEAHLKRAFRDSTANFNVSMQGRTQFRHCRHSALSGFVIQQARHVTYLFRCDVGSAYVTCAACGGVCGVFVLVPPAVRYGKGCSPKASTR